MEVASTHTPSQPLSKTKGNKRRNGDNDTKDIKRIKKEKPTRPSPLQAILMPIAEKSQKISSRYQMPILRNVNGVSNATTQVRSQTV